jgi:hypothetical protein
MFYPASAAIAERHPDLAGLVASLDEFLHSLADLPINIDTIADLLDEDADVLARLFRLYQDQGVLVAQSILQCPNDMDVLQVDEDGALWCELCETTYDRDTCLESLVYQVRQPAWLQQQADTRTSPHSHALIIGVNGYRELPQLATPVGDATALAEFLASPTGAGFAPAHVRLLLEQQATRPEISLALEWLARSTTPRDQVLIYFAGHGVRRLGGFEPGEYLCPFDTSVDSLRTTAIHTDDLSAALSALPAGQVLVLLDACYAGGLVDPQQGRRRTYFGLSDTAYSRLSDGSGRVLIASSRHDEVSWELAALKRGLFTHYLLDGLRGSAAGEDHTVRVLDLYNYLASNVPKHRAQHPVIKGELDGNFVIVPATRPRSSH